MAGGGVSDFDRTLARVGIEATTLGTSSGSVLYNLRAFAASFADPDAEDVAGAEQYGVAGLISRPRDKDAAGSAEGLAARTSDDLVTFASRDLRVSAARGAVPKGAFSLAGYTGAHLTIFDASSSTDGSIVLHQPTAITSGGVKQPHDLVIDGAHGAERITITHAKGHKVTIDETGKLTVRSVTGAVLLEVDDAGGVKATRDGKPAQGVALGIEVFNLLSLIVIALGQIKVALGTAGAGVVVPPAPSSAAMVSTALKASE